MPNLGFGETSPHGHEPNCSRFDIIFEGMLHGGSPGHVYDRIESSVNEDTDFGAEDKQIERSDIAEVNGDFAVFRGQEHDQEDPHGHVEDYVGDGEEDDGNAGFGFIVVVVGDSALF